MRHEGCDKCAADPDEDLTCDPVGLLLDAHDFATLLECVITAL
jgi:hypothetical protein